MIQYFLGSYIVTIVGLFGAYFWGNHVAPGTGWACVFIAIVLSVLEVSLSFDNAVVNAMKLEKMSHVWRHRFLTWGILIAVFGMRFLFPILVVSVFAKIGMYDVAKIALTDSEQYAHYLHETHAPIVTFGGTFLMMLFLNYFFNHEKEVHWLKKIEAALSHLDHFKGIEIVITLISLMIAQHFIHGSQNHYSLLAGIAGVVIYLIIDGVTHYLENTKKCDLLNALLIMLNAEA